MAPQLSAQLASGLKPIKVFRAQHLGVLRAIRTAKVMNGDTLRMVGAFSPLTAAMSSPSITSYVYFNAEVPMASDLVTCAPVGGFGPFTYSWAKISGDTLAISSPTTASTQFTAAAVGPGVAFSGAYQCTITDSVGQIATGAITVTLQNFGGFG